MGDRWVTRRPRANSSPTTSVVAAVAAMVVAALASAAPPVAAHSSLTSPMSMSFTRDCRISFNGAAARNCPGPCPNVMLRTGGTGHSSAEPAATYSRGQQVRVRWTRNNHEGGFVRWSIVPVASMMDHRVHEQMAFRWGCWSAGRFQCKTDWERKTYCVDDKLGEPVGHAYQDWIQVPRIYPDGDYVLAFAWYGGVRDNLPDRRPVQSSLGDYYDCSYIRIQGGGVVQPTYQPFFRVGFGTRFPDRCVASVNRLGPCRVEPCTVGGGADTPSLFLGGEMKPSQFVRGRMPPLLRASWFYQPVAGKLGANKAYVTDLSGKRRSELKTWVVNDVVIDGNLPSFTIEATVWGNVRVDGVAFRVNGRLARVEREGPWFLTGPNDAGNGRQLWGDWTTGQVITISVTPMGIEGPAIKVYPKNFVIRVKMAG